MYVFRILSAFLIFKSMLSPAPTYFIFYNVLCYAVYPVSSTAAHTWHSIALKNWKLKLQGDIRWEFSRLTASHLPAVAQPNVLCFWDLCSPRNSILDFLPWVAGICPTSLTGLKRVNRVLTRARSYAHGFSSRLRRSKLWGTAIWWTRSARLVCLRKLGQTVQWMNVVTRKVKPPTVKVNSCSLDN